MKLRNIVIVLLVALMVFAFASCKNDPEPPQPGKDTVAKITVTKGIETSVWGNEKIQLVWDLGADSEGIKDGSVFEMQFRTNRAPYEFDLRNNKKGAYKKEDGSAASVDVRWVYQESAESLDSLTYDEKTGWYTMKYTFSDEGASGKEPDYDTYRYTVLGVNFKCFLLVGDVFEVKNAKLDGKVLPLTADINNQPNKSELEVIEDHEWTMDKTYVLLYEAEGTEWRSDDGVPAEAVKVGEHPVGLSEAGYTFTYKDSEGEAVDLATLVLEEDTVIDFVKIGVERTVTFDVDGATSTVKVENGQTVDKPAEDPEKEGYLFDVWCSDSTKETEYNFDTPVTGDITLYARFGTKRTVTFNMMDHGTQITPQYILDGKTATEPEDPKTSGYRFKGWYTAATCAEGEEFNFATPILKNYELFAKWDDAPTVQFTYDLNYEGAAEPTQVDVFVDEPAVAPEDPERSGWLFLGWYDADGDEYTFKEDVTEAMTLYAHWAEAIVKLTATKGRNEGMNSYDKYQIEFSDSFNLNDVLTVTFRSSRPIDQFSIRHSAGKWVYEQPKEGYPLPEGFLSGPDQDGWITATYTFGAYYYDGSSAVTYPATGVLFHLRGMIIVDDFLEIKEISINGVSKAIEDIPALISKSKYVKPTAEIVADHDWTEPDTYVVFFYPDPATDSASAIAVEKNGLVTKPADPTKEGFSFIGWCKDKTYSADRMWDFDTETLTKDRMLYAMWEPVVE